MSHDWFRSWHGAPTDPKWRTVAKRAGVRPGDVAAIVWVLLDRASQAKERGSIEGYDAEVIADALGYEPEHIIGVVSALHDKRVLVNSVFSGWEKYQPKREDVSAERTREWRERKRGNSGKPEKDEQNQQNSDESEHVVTHGDASEHKVTLDKIRLDKKEDISLPSEARPKPVRTPKTRKAYPDDFEAFWKAYPTDANQSKAEALAAWQRLSFDDRQQAIASVPGFVAFCQKDPTYRPIHACRYLAKRRFEGHATGPPVQTVYTLPPLKVLTDEEIEAQMLQAEAEEDDRRNSDELSAGSVDMRKVASA